MLLIIVVVFLVLLNAILLYVQKKVSSPGSDHPYHLGLINGIRNNKHHFVKSYPNIIGEKNFAYPQFYHWILSYLPENVYTVRYRYINIIVKLIEIVAFNLFLYFLYLST